MKLLSYWKTIAWTIIIIVLCSLPGSQFPKGNLFNIPHLDKWVHGFLYLIWGFLCLYDLKYSNGENKQLLKTLVIGMCIGGTIECYQHYLIPNRMGDVWDFLANVIGLVLSVFVFKLYLKKADNEVTV